MKTKKGGETKTRVWNCLYNLVCLVYMKESLEECIKDSYQWLTYGRLSVSTL